MILRKQVHLSIRDIEFNVDMGENIHTEDPDYSRITRIGTEGIVRN
jgi:hypothetical protein